MAKPKTSALDRGRELQRSLLDEASKVYESTKRVQQLSLPMAGGTKADQMLMPGFDVAGILDPSRTWREAVSEERTIERTVRQAARRHIAEGLEDR